MTPPERGWSVGVRAYLGAAIRALLAAALIMNVVAFADPDNYRGYWRCPPDQRLHRCAPQALLGWPGLIAGERIDRR
ncbi:MAG: hypothetical protein AAFW46_10000 [Pseudomonadota bacterium]